MRLKLTALIALIIAFAVAAMLWLSTEAHRLEARLLALDRAVQTERLMQISLPRIQRELDALLAAERARFVETPDLNAADYSGPSGERAPWVAGAFLSTPYELKTPAGEDAFRRAMAAHSGVMTNLRRKADSPAARLVDPDAPAEALPPGSGKMPVFDVRPVVDIDANAPFKILGSPSPFFAWSWGGNLVYMRSIPTNHGGVAEGVMFDVDALAHRLLPFVESGLHRPSLRIAAWNEKPNLSGLPLLVDPANEVVLPDTSARRQALFGTLMTAWIIAVVAILLILGLLVLYARMERRRSDFVSAVTHELRTPLTTFSLYTEMLDRRMVPDEKKQEYYATLHRESKRLGHLVENVLAFARLSRGKTRGRQDVEACGPMFTRLFAEQKEKLEAAGFSVSTAISPNARLLTIRTDLLTVGMILTNLTDNAVKYGRGEHPSVQMTVQAGRRFLQVRVRDKGAGISPEDAKKLFHPFNRSAEADSGKKPGIGLGLALSRDLARSIGGDLTLEGSSQQGTIFLLTLPLGN